MFLWHLKSKHFAGDTIYPLNQLLEIYPEIAAAAREKYANREWLLERRIEPLNCLWNDVVQLSPVHPELLFTALRDVGFPARKVQFFEVPVDLLAPSQTVMLQVHNRPGIKELDPNDYLEFTPANLKRFRDLPTETIEHYRDFHANGKNPFLFIGVVHVLFKGKISINDVNVIEV